MLACTRSKTKNLLGYLYCYSKGGQQSQGLTVQQQQVHHGRSPHHLNIT